MDFQDFFYYYIFTITLEVDIIFGTVFYIKNDTLRNLQKPEKAFSMLLYKKC